MAKIQYGYYEKETFEKVIAGISRRDNVFKCIFCLIRRRGIRPHEIVKLTMYDIFPDFGSLSIRRKNGTTEIVKIDEETKKSLKEYVEENKHRFINGFIFPSSTQPRDHISTNWVRKKWAHYFVKAGFHSPNVRLSGKRRNLLRLYDLRASFATDVHSKTGDSITTMFMLGNRDIRSVVSYVRRAHMLKEKELISSIFAKNDTQL